MKFIFIDFETNGLNGPITEAFSLFAETKDNKMKIIRESLKTDSFDFIMFDATMALMNEESLLVFWDHWMPQWLLQNRPDLYQDLKGRWAVLKDQWLFYSGFDMKNRSIQGITKSLLNRDHQGNARQDTLDLKDCLTKMLNLHT